MARSLQSQPDSWDLGQVSPPLQAYFDTLTDKSVRLLIVGAGNAHEARYLHELGFTNVHVLDIVPSVLDNFANANPTFNPKHLICHDFFDVHMLGLGQFDIIIEQTFLCAIDPSRRDEYARQVHRLLRDKGRLVGVLFDCEFESSPPFGGSMAEYRALFEPYFGIQTMERCHNSVKPREGRELFINLVKRGG
ncbi:TPMT family class I SAM-dependent methyltransferase [Moraxella bovoculi]|uniref:TPMT family class I SAM-dependent methyltransferase n=1 Tax=Moraxella bovoculi TaxID=386891 RepID=UPI000AEBB90B|nr:TPMT family class I SAM-dependent methyltransferase [Moraxella bovoculi]